MKVHVDRAQCTGHGRCASYGPDVFELDDLGFNAADGIIEVPVGLEDQGRDGAQACPERAIRIVEE